MACSYRKCARSGCDQLLAGMVMKRTTFFGEGRAFEDSLIWLRNRFSDGEEFIGWMVNSYLDHFDRSHRRALDRLQALLDEGPKRVVDVFSVLFARKIDEDVLSLATGEALANLNYLIKRGRVVVTEDAEGVAWYELSSMDDRIMNPAELEAIERLLQRRRSCRAFLAQPIDHALIIRMFALAQRSASWCNTQPWQIIVTRGAATERFRAAWRQRAAEGLAGAGLAFPR